MLRKLTDEEIAASKAAVKRANQILSRKKKELSERIVKLTKLGGVQPYRLMEERDAIKYIRGLPVRLAVGEEEIVIDYRFLKTFLWKVRQFTIDITISETGCLLVNYGRPPHYGQLELRDLPKYQVELLDDLPLVVLER